MLRCNCDTIYTGYTTNILKRYKEHIEGISGAKYIRICKDLKLIGCWKIFGTKGDAISVESFVKKLTKSEKESLISNPQKLNKLYKENGNRTLLIKKENLKKISKFITQHDIKEIRKIGRTPFMQ